MRHLRNKKITRPLEHRPMVLVTARILNSEQTGSYQSSNGHFTMIIFLSSNGRLVFTNMAASIDVEVKIGTTIFIGNSEHAQIMEWDAPNKLLEIAVEDRFVSDVVAAVTPSKTALSDVVGVYGPEAGFGALATRLARKITAHNTSSASLIADGYYCAPTTRFLIAMMVDFRGVARNYKVSVKRPLLSDHTLTDVINHIEHEISSAIRVSDMAKIASQSRFHFARTFKASTGRSPHSYILDSRLRRAEYLLSETNEGLSQIAHASGFNSQSHFTTAFKKRIGVTPGHYRELHR